MLKDAVMLEDGKEEHFKIRLHKGSGGSRLQKITKVTRAIMTGVEDEQGSLTCS